MALVQQCSDLDDHFNDADEHLHSSELDGIPCITDSETETVSNSEDNSLKSPILAWEMTDKNCQEGRVVVVGLAGLCKDGYGLSNESATETAPMLKMAHDSVIVGKLNNALMQETVYGSACEKEESLNDEDVESRQDMCIVETSETLMKVSDEGGCSTCENSLTAREKERGSCSKSSAGEKRDCGEFSSVCLADFDLPELDVDTISGAFPTSRSHLRRGIGKHARKLPRTFSFKAHGKFLSKPAQGAKSKAKRPLDSPYSSTLRYNGCLGTSNNECLNEYRAPELVNGKEILPLHLPTCGLDGVEQKLKDSLTETSMDNLQSELILNKKSSANITCQSGNMTKTTVMESHHVFEKGREIHDDNVEKEFFFITEEIKDPECRLESERVIDEIDRKGTFEGNFQVKKLKSRELNFELNGLLEVNGQNERGNHSILEENVEVQGDAHKMHAENPDQNRDVYRLPEESFEQPRHILFWIAAFVIQIVGFQLNLMLQVLGTLVWLPHHCYFLLLDPLQKILQAEGKVTDEQSRMFSCITEWYLTIRQGASGVQPFVVKGAKKMGYGCLAVTFVFIILSILFFFAFVFNFFIVKIFVEEPIQITEVLHFDYTQPHPVASINLLSPSAPLKSFSTLSKSKGTRSSIISASNKFHVTVQLTLPASDHNRHLGVFQVAAELFSVTGHLLARRSQPCMLRFKSAPIRHIETLLMTVPLLVGISDESQTLVLQLLEWQEEKASPSALLRILLEPRSEFRAGSGLPEIYSAEIHVTSELPWMKATVRSWKWTFYVWIGLWFYVVEVAVVLCLCRQAFLPKIWSGQTDSLEDMRRGSGLHTDSSRNPGQRRHIPSQVEHAGTQINGE